ncbi:hypothetical protein RB199_21215 [Streptomyces libani]
MWQASWPSWAPCWVPESPTSSRAVRPTAASGSPAAERLRQERIDAYCAYAGALLEYRRVLVHRWFVLHEDDRCGEDTPELREEVYKTRYSAQEAMFRAQMVSDDPEILDRSEQVMAATTELHWARDREALTELRATTRQGIRDFIAATSRHVR